MKYATILTHVAEGRQMQVLEDEQWHDIETQDIFKKLAVGVSPEHLRIKPVTIRIGELDVPEPMKDAPKYGTTYYITDINTPTLFWAMEWQNSDVDKLRLKRNQCHLDSGNAVEHGRALIVVSGGAV